MMVGLSRGLLRERDGERGAPPGPALYLDRAAVRLGDPLADGEAEPRPRPLAGAGAGRVGPPEAIEDVGQVARGDADAGIGDGQGDATVGLPQLHADAAARRGVLHRVGDEVQDQLADPARVHRQDYGLGRRREIHLYTRLLGEQLAGLTRLLEDGPQVDRLEVERRDTLVGAGERE